MGVETQPLLGGEDLRLSPSQIEDVTDRMSSALVSD